MKELPIHFGHDGRTLRQLKRTATAAIYELIGHQGLSYVYEVLRIAIKKESECFGAVFPKRECYPSASQFGRMAWSYGTRQMEQAIAKYNRLSAPAHQSLTANDPRAFTRHHRIEPERASV
jgi:hypothetical protein